ncbi:hypothetical protein GBAR_LOCUS8714 [Geodia barretti]|nr:hypothetical protein GBAR_LOCUS8714 [Geodia barretti]
MIRGARSLSCTRNTACNKTDCTSSLLSGYTLTMELLSCRNPPGVRVILKDGSRVLSSRVVDDDASIDTGLFGSTLRITLNQLDGAIGLGVSLESLLGSSTLIPYTIIPLDNGSCTPPTTETPSIETPTTNRPTVSTTAATPTNTAATTTIQTPTPGSVNGTQPTQGPNAETCNGFDQLIRNVMEMTCTRNPECDTANCTITNPSFSGHTLSLTLLSCRVPRPGVRLVARNPGGQLLIDRVLDQSQSGIELTPNTVLDMTVDQRNNNSIGLAATVRADLGFTTISIPILTYTILPLDKRSCSPEGIVASVTPSPAPPTPGVVPTTSTTGSTSTSTPGVVPTTSTTSTTTIQSPIPTPTSAPTAVSTIAEPSSDTPTSTDGTSTTGEITTEQPTTADGKNTTCSVLEEIAANAEVFTCTADTTEPCDTVDCSAFDLYTAEFVLLPCRTPPAIRIVINQEETPVLDETIDRSRVIVVPQLLGLVLNITLDQFEDAIGLQVEGTLRGNTLNVIKYTVIPLEKAKNCKGTGEGGKDGEGSEGTKAPGDSEEPSSRSAGFQFHFFWPLLLLSLITLK